ncbi:MAG: FAD binding domain-containing protein [Bacteroidetes bacterium]|nr:FAD binding domain-containing protein [Bacteroidota bacterium]
MILQKHYLQPLTVDEASTMAEKNKESFKFIAGGTDVIVNKNQGNENAACLIDLSKIEALKGIAQTGNFLRIGALEKLAVLAKNPLIEKQFSVLAEAALSVGSPLIRLSATIGGNVLCENRCLYYNQSEWWREAVGYCLKCDGDICIATQGKNACFSELVSDTAPALIALNAQLTYSTREGTHTLPLESIYTGDGVTPRNLEKNAIVQALLIPTDKTYRTFFAKLRERESLEFTSLTCCMSADENDQLRIVLSGVDPKPVVVTGNLNDDPEILITKAVKSARTVDNDMYTRKYRREMIRVYISRGYKKLKNAL